MYLTLRRLKKQGLLKSRRLASHRGPTRIVYETTAAGHKELPSWLQTGPPLQDMRHILLAQIYLADRPGR